MEAAGKTAHKVTAMTNAMVVVEEIADAAAVVVKMRQQAHQAATR